MTQWQHHCVLWSGSIQGAAQHKKKGSKNNGQKHKVVLYLHRSFISELDMRLAARISAPALPLSRLGLLAFHPCISFQCASRMSIQITAEPWKPTKHMNTWLRGSIVLVQAEHKCHALLIYLLIMTDTNPHPFFFCEESSLFRFLLYTDCYHIKRYKPILLQGKALPRASIWYGLSSGSDTDNTVLLLPCLRSVSTHGGICITFWF